MIGSLRLLRWRWQHRRHAWALRSKTYLDDSELVGLYSNRKAAERYLAHCVPPIPDAVIEEWCLASK